ncbi:MAG: T9SS type A sorting domain-containing protein, partial [Bacteroidales bacterium]|nr:T9SS type A sorting domain-containing protein [Bacteroidales bacterium]
MQSMEMIPVFGEPEGGIFTPTLMVVNDTNYFLPFAMGVGIHTIVYAYQDGGTGCYGYDTAIVAVLAADAEITFPEDDTKKFFCYNDQPFTIMGHNTANDTGTFTISGGIGLADNNDNTATIDPSQLNGGIYEVTYRYFNKTYLEVKESFEVEYVQNIWFIGFNASSYCDNAGRVPLNGNVTGGIFSGKAVTGNTSAGFYYEPQLASPGMDTVFYTLTTTRGCSRQIYKPLIIRDAADISFTVLDTCVSTDVSDSTVFINNTTCTDPVISWEWNFGDPTSGDNNISTLKNPKHKYVRNGYRNISLTATTDYCQSSGSMNFDFGNKPQADFSWSTECFHEGQKIKFTADSSEDFNIEDYKWKINNGAKIDSFMTKNTEYTFSKEGNYDVELFVRSDYGCTDKITKTIPLKPTYELLEGSSFYDDFEGEIKGWVSVSEDTVNSWTLGEPAFGTPTGGDYVWYTDIAFDSETGRAYKEQSSVTSPCFSFHGIKKPMVGFYLHNDYNDNWNDGAVLQYKADSSKEWKEIGDLNDGIHWYQDYKISGKPGGESIGWSKDSKGPWVEARHSLDELKGKTDVQFRIAYGSDGTPFETNGVAFDNFWIHERNKIVMVEHFTNASDAASKSADSTLDAFVNRNSLDIVDIQYHTSFPGVDPFNEQNKVDPGTRVLYYQLSSVPVTILNGGTNNDYIFDYDNVLLDLLLIKNQSLLDPDFSITLQTSMVNNTLSVDAELRPLREVRDQQVTFHLAIVERIISGVTGANGDTLFESVLKTILSSTSYTNDWDPAVDVKTINKTWNLKNTYNTDEIRVVAFVQNEASKEIYQAMIDLFDVPTALRNENIIHRSKESIGFIVFPNPVRDEAWLRFDEETVKKTRVELFDINGKLIMTQEVFPGAKQYAITMSDCPEGLYFIRITSDNRLMGLQKLVIAR